MSNKQDNKAGRTLRRRARKGGTLRPHSSAHNLEYIILSQWMKRNHFVLKRPFLSPAIFNSTGRGLMTQHPVHPGSILISIPHHLLITPSLVFTSLQGYINKWDKQLTPQQALSVFLLAERKKKESSFWCPYINILPKQYTTPAFFSMSELDLLPSHVRARATVEISKVQEAFRLVTDFVRRCWADLIPLVTLPDFLWAWYSVNTRSVYYKRELCDAFMDDGNYIALAPFLDLLNHSCDAKITAEFNVDSNCYEIRTEDSYRKFDQVFISYGNHDNLHLLMEYGFVLPDNPNDAVDFHFDELFDIALKMEIKYLKEKKDILITEKFDKKLCCSAEGISWNLQVAIRVLAMDWAELRDWKRVMQGRTISDRNEVTAKALVSTIITGALDTYRDNLGKFQGLQRDTMTDHERLAYDINHIQLTLLQSALACI